ncbi:hypothetical protein L8W59_05450 [Campylobacter lari]|nr:hypothetical protein [Campylobacter lari]
MSVDMSSKIDELAHNMGEVINRADALMDKFEKNEGDIAGIEEKLEKAATTDKDNLFSGNNSFEKPISIPEATKENEGINLGQADGRYSQLLTQSIKKTVGIGGDYENFQDAINDISKYHNTNNTLITLELVSNIEISSKILLKCLISRISIDFKTFKISLSNGYSDNTIFQLEYCSTIRYLNTNIDCKNIENIDIVFSSYMSPLLFSGTFNILNNKGACVVTTEANVYFINMKDTSQISSGTKFGYNHAFRAVGSGGSITFNGGTFNQDSGSLSKFVQLGGRITWAGTKFTGSVVNSNIPEGQLTADGYIFGK